MFITLDGAQLGQQTFQVLREKCEKKAVTCNKKGTSEVLRPKESRQETTYFEPPFFLMNDEYFLRASEEKIVFSTPSQNSTQKQADFFSNYYVSLVYRGKELTRFSNSTQAVFFTEPGSYEPYNNWLISGFRQVFGVQPILYDIDKMADEAGVPRLEPVPPRYLKTR